MPFASVRIIVGMVGPGWDDVVSAEIGARGGRFFSSGWGRGADWVGTPELIGRSRGGSRAAVRYQAHDAGDFFQGMLPRLETVLCFDGGVVCFVLILFWVVW